MEKKYEEKAEKIVWATSIFSLGPSEHLDPLNKKREKRRGEKNPKPYHHPLWCPTRDCWSPSALLLLLSPRLNPNLVNTYSKFKEY